MANPEFDVVRSDYVMEQDGVLLYTLPPHLLPPWFRKEVMLRIPANQIMLKLQ